MEQKITTNESILPELSADMLARERADVARSRLAEKLSSHIGKAISLMGYPTRVTVNTIVDPEGSMKLVSMPVHSIAGRARGERPDPLELASVALLAVESNRALSVSTATPEDLIALDGDPSATTSYYFLIDNIVRLTLED